MANTKKIRSKHNNLLNYFIHDKRDLSKAYIDKCEKFFKELKKKMWHHPKYYAEQRAERRKLQASSLKHQANQTLS